MTIANRSFRLVCKPVQIPMVEALLEAEGFRFEPEPFSQFCRRIVAEPFALGSSLAAFFGYIYIQDRSSMLPPLALAPPQGAAVLDMAASPGSKTGFLAQLVGESGFVLANEPNPSRLATLRANLHVANLLQIATCGYAGEKLPLGAGQWGYILLDTPCSGWGTALKNPRAPKIWQGGKIGRLINLQRELLAKAATLLEQDGLLLYSTCTTNPAENEEQTCFAIAELGLEAMPLTPFAGFVFEKTRNALLVNGTASASQGFYLSLLRKTAASPKQDFVREDYDSLLPKGAIASPVCDPDLLPPGEIGIFGGKAHFMPAAALNLPRELKWHGPLLGKCADASFTPNTRLRALIPAPKDFMAPSGIVLETIADLKKLLSGVAIQTDIQWPAAGVWWRELPLGICQIKNRRVIARFN